MATGGNDGAAAYSAALPLSIAAGSNQVVA